MAVERIRASRLPELIAQFGKLGPGSSVDSASEGFVKGLQIQQSLQERQEKRQRALLELENAKRELALKKQKEQDVARLIELRNLTPQSPTGAITGNEATARTIPGPALPPGVEGPRLGVPVAEPRPVTFGEDPEAAIRAEQEAQQIIGRQFGEDLIKQDLGRSEKEFEAKLDVATNEAKQPRLESSDIAKDIGVDVGTKVKDIELLLKERQRLGAEKIALAKMKESKQKGSIDLTKEAGKIVNLKTQTKGLKDLLSRIPNIPGLGSAASLTRGRSFLGIGKEPLAAAKQYQDQLPTVAVSAYRTISQDQRINNEDARDRALPLFPQFGEPQQVRDAKFLFLDEMFNNAAKINAAQQQNLLSPERAAERFSALENRLLIRSQAIQQIQLENKRRESQGKRAIKLTNENISVIENQLVDSLAGGGEK